MVDTTLGRLWARFWYLTGGVGIRFKIMGIVLLLIVIFGLGITLQGRDSLTQTLTTELEKRGVALASDLAARSTDLVLTNNTFDLYRLLKNTVQNNEDMRYAFIMGADGNVIAHSFSAGLPAGLVKANYLGAKSKYNLVKLDTNEGMMLDIAIPVFGGRAGVARVGMSTTGLHAAVSVMTTRWLIITSIVSLIGLLAAYLLTSVLTRPIKHLVEVTKAISRGNLQHKAPVWAPDEIGRLGIAFNTMTDSLAQSHAESEVFQAELLRRNLELAALNAIANEVSRSRELTDIMHRSLVKILEFINLDAGWVSILSDDGERAITICHTGLTPETLAVVNSVEPDKCNCKDAITRKSVIVVSNGEHTCPLLLAGLTNGKEILQHITVPLVARSHTLGLLHLASMDQARISSENIQLLGAMGHQLGVAIENSNLWEQLKHKEEIRGRLLEETITAQEAERKRIARELHDQTGQSLTSLMVGLKMLETAHPEEIKQRIRGMRQLTAQTLEDVHNLAVELRPSSLDDLGLVAAVEQYTREFTNKFGVNAEFQTIGFDHRRLSPEVEIALYRIVQEALTNVVKHAGAKKVSVLIEARQSSIVAIVEDDGKGFDVQPKSRGREGRLGLYGMYERTELIGGKLTIESRPGKGTTVFVEVPLG